jgi:hydroxymethylbilane synthase
MRLVVGTRGSKLAMWQARHVGALIQRDRPDVQVEFHIIKTSGDKMTQAPLALIGGKGLFTKEIRKRSSTGEWIGGAFDEGPPYRDSVGLKSLRSSNVKTAGCVRITGRSGLDDLEPGARIGTQACRRRRFC